MMDTSTLAGTASRVAARPSYARLMRKLVPYLDVLPAALFVGAFLIYPMVITTWRGFTQFDGITDPVFVGLQNYADLFADPHFLRSLYNTFIWTIAAVILPVSLGLAFAITLNGVKGAGFFKSVIYLPATVSAAAVGILFSFVFAFDNGALNTILRGIGLAAGFQRNREGFLQELGRALAVAEEERQPAEVVEQPPDVEPVLLLLVERLRPLGVRAREHPLPLALRDDRRLEIPVRERLSITEPLGELEGRLDVGARGLPVTLAPITTRPPPEDAASQAVVDRIRVAKQLERLGEDRRRGRDRRQPVPSLPDVEEDVGAVDVGERVALDEVARRLEQLQRFLEPSELGACSRSRKQRPELEVRILDRARLLGAVELGDRLIELPCRDRRLRARDQARQPFVLGGRQAGLEVAARDLQPLCEPLDRRLVGTDPAALDLAHVLLREAPEAELGLRQAARDAQLTHALT